MLNIFIHFSESNSCIMPNFFYMLISTKKEYKTQFLEQKVKYNKYDRYIMQIGKDIIICSV